MLNVLACALVAAAGPPTPSAAARAKRERQAQISPRSPGMQVLSTMEVQTLLDILPKLCATRSSLQLLCNTLDEDSLKSGFGIGS
jgi:hypothetical protein